MREIKKLRQDQGSYRTPNLTNIQITSYDALLQKTKTPEQRESVGLQAAFREVFPIDETERGRQTDLVLDFLETACKNRVRP